jgi:acetyl-CoA C-acetyltransferase
MRPVAIIGVGQTKIDEQWERSIRQIAVEAIRAALIDAGREDAGTLFVGNMMSGILNSQNNLGPLVADWAGLKVPAVKVEAACGSGGAALRCGLMAVASAEVDSASWWVWKR